MLRSLASAFPFPLQKLSGKNGQKDIGCKELGGSSQSLDPEIFFIFFWTISSNSVAKAGEGNTSYRTAKSRSSLRLEEHPALLLPSPFLKSYLGWQMVTGGQLAVGDREGEMLTLWISAQRKLNEIEDNEDKKRI